MAKKLRLSNEEIATLLREFEANLRSMKTCEGSVTFTKNFQNAGNERAKVVFLPAAWEKMQALVREFSTEVAWHGLVKRGDEPNTYIIYDIIVFKQTVTGATWTTNQAEYEQWLMEQPDEVFNNIRMHGHSHVNMGTSPSATDLNQYASYIEQLGSDMFYIFMIWNKKLEKTIKIYDMASNTLFETADCDVSVDYGDWLPEFIENAKKLVGTKTYQTGFNLTGAPYEKYNYGNAASCKNAETRPVAKRWWEEDGFSDSRWKNGCYSPRNVLDDYDYEDGLYD